MHAPTHHPTPALDEPTDPEPSTARRPEPVGRDWIDTAIEWASGLAAVAMFAYGVALSYSVLYAIAGAAGLPGWSRRLWPLGWELFMASAALNALAEQRHLRSQVGWRRVPWYPLSLTAATAGGSILLNWFHPAIPLDPPPGWLKSLVYGLPPLEAVLAWHLFLLRIAHRRHQAPAPVRAETVPQAADRQADPEAAPGRDEQAATAPTSRLAHQQAGDGPGGPQRSPPERVPAGPVRARPAPARPSAGTAGGLEAGLLAQARAAAAEHHNTVGRPISRDALRQALRVSNQTAGALLRELRTEAADPDRQPQDRGQPTGTTHIGNHGGAVRADQPAEPGPAQPPHESEPGPAVVAGNGAGGPPAGLGTLVSTVLIPGPAGDGQEGTGDA